MAKYSIELRDVVATHNIFDFKYPFYDENKRPDFEQAFIRHFYFREIGCDTVDRFKLYLQDKMNIVFPYYNELFKSASIEYDVLDNYKLTETYERNVSNINKHDIVSSTVGQSFDEQETESNDSRETNGLQNQKGNVNNTVKETVNTTTDSSGNSKTDKTETSNGETSSNGTNESATTTTGTDGKTTNVSVSDNKEKTNKFLDTPQGLTNLSNSNYVTNVTYDNENNLATTETTDSGNHSQETETNGKTTESGTSKNTVTGSSETETTDNSNTETERTVTDTTNTSNDITSNETATGKQSGTFKGEQKTTQDNNTRSNANGEQKEVYTLTRKGNIGVDTDSDAIEKHNRLQKTLRNIEKMFFDECEDLFMLVF